MRCEPAHHFTVAKARAWRSAIDDAPLYQRGGDAWTLAQRQRFMDSLLNGYDVPKLYLHDLRGRHPTKVYAVVDGKQRLTALWSFLGDGFGLADDSWLEASSGGPETPAGPIRTGPLRFSELGPWWQRRLLGTYLSVVLIREASEADIDELFARLNDGSPLTPAEARNAIAGDMSRLVREIARLPDITDRMAFPDHRGAHREVAAMALALEDARRSGAVATADLSPAALDGFVRSGRILDPARRDALADGVARRLREAGRRLSAEASVETPAEALAWLRSAWSDDRGTDEDATWLSRTPSSDRTTPDTSPSG